MFSEKCLCRIPWSSEQKVANPVDHLITVIYIKRELLGHVRKRKLSYFGHLCRDHGFQITKTAVEGYVEGTKAKSRRRVRPRKQYIDNIKQWTQLTTSSQCVRATDDRSRWKELATQTMVATHDLPKRRRYKTNVHRRSLCLLRF